MRNGDSRPEVNAKFRDTLRGTSVRGPHGPSTNAAVGRDSGPKLGSSFHIHTCKAVTNLTPDFQSEILSSSVRFPHNRVRFCDSMGFLPFPCSIVPFCIYCMQIAHTYIALRWPRSTLPLRLRPMNVGSHSRKLSIKLQLRRSETCRAMLQSLTISLGCIR